MYSKREAFAEEHKKNLAHRTEMWGKQKFKPKPYAGKSKSFSAPVQQQPEESQPWQHVKNDIIDDAAEAKNREQLDVDSEKAKQFYKQREQNYRRLIIEAKRNEPTTWEKFEDDANPSTSRSKRKKQTNNASKAADKLQEARNFYRKQITKAVMMKRNKVTMKRNNAQFKHALNDLSKTSVVRGQQIQHVQQPKIQHKGKKRKKTTL